MTRLVFLLLNGAIFLLCVNAHSQHVFRYIYYDNADKQVKTRYQVIDTINNIAQGEYVSYFRNGGVESRGRFDNNKPVGKWDFFYKSGELKMTSLSLENKEGYVKKAYYYKNGQKSMEGEIYNHHRKGLWTMYAENGDLQSKVNYSGATGKRTEYYPSGNVLGKGPYKGRQKTGFWHYFAEDKTLSSEGAYEKGKKEGLWKYYYSSGGLTSSGNYKSDKKEGKWQYFFKNGTVSSKGGYRDGMQYGEWQMFNEDGSLDTRRLLKETGEEELTVYYPTGEVKAMGNVEHGENHGEWTYFYRNGSKQGKCDFNQGSGVYFGYYPNGKLQTKGYIRDNLQVGIWEAYDEEGTLTKKDSVSNMDTSPLSSGEALKEHEDKSVGTKPVVKNTIKRSTYHTRGGRYFSSRSSEYRGIAIQMNPFFAFIGRIPIAFEFYSQDRIGYEFLFNLERDPFFRWNNDIKQNEIFTRGYSIAMRQKFYNPFKIGLWYFGHTIVFTRLAHSGIMQIGSLSSMVLATEMKIEYGVLLGTRLMRNTGRNGLTLDAYVGYTIGYRGFIAPLVYDEIFSRLQQGPFAHTFRFGINFGYVVSVNR